jgi:tricorn protease
MLRTIAFLTTIALFFPGCTQALSNEPVSARGGQGGAGVAPIPGDGRDDLADAPPAGNVDFPRFPSISPDGSKIVFSWRGDLWLVSSDGGLAVRLTRHPGDDLRSTWSPDGTRIAFDSNRNGYRNLHIMNADGTDVRQVSDIDRGCALVGFGTDDDGAEVLTCYAFLEGDPYGAPRPYMISTRGGDVRRVHGAFGSFPQVSPDGTQVAFARGHSRWSRRHYRGPDNRDVWLYRRADRSFHPVTEWDGNDSHARWVGNETLLFLSDRNLSTLNLHRVGADQSGKRAKQLTFFENDDVQDFDVSADGTTAVLMAWDTLYTLALNEPEAKPVALRITASEDEADNYKIKSIDREVSQAALSPDGKAMAMIAYGEVYVRNIEEKSPTRRVTRSHAREKHVTWSPDGLKLYFVSDRDGTDSIYAATVNLTRGEVKEEFDKAVNPPEEKEEEEVKETDTEEKKDEEKPETTEKEKEGAEKSSEDEEKEPADNGEEEAEEDKEDDEKKKKEEEELPKELDPKRWHDAMKFNIEPVVATRFNDSAPSPSPDGKMLAFRRTRGDLIVLDLETKEERTLLSSWDFGLDWRWSPDSRHIAYAVNDLNFNVDVWIVPADGSKDAVNITKHPDDDENPRWSADGKILSFVSDRVNEEYDLYRVYLDKDLEAFTPKEIADYYEEAKKAAKKRKPLKIEKPEEEEEEAEENGKGENDEKAEEPAGKEDDKKDEDKEKEEEEGEKEKEEEEEPKELDLEDAYLRVRRITTLSDSERNNEITPGGDRFIFTATIDKRGLYSVKWDGTERKRLGDAMAVQHVSLTGDKVVVVKDGRAGTIAPDGKKVEYVDLDDKIRIDLQEQSSQKFMETARRLGEQFYHPDMKGLDWPALTERYHALARKTRTTDEFNHVAFRFLGELNASHLGVYGGSNWSSSNRQPQGHLGTLHKRVKDGFEITGVIPESPAAKGTMALQVGDVVTAIELEPFRDTDTIETRLKGRVDKETLLTIRRVLESGEEKELNILITPIGSGAEDRLKYKAWRLNNAELASASSDGRIGYIHIRGMDQGSLDVFERDLYAACEGKEGLVIDVRNNGGGWTADRLLSSIMVRQHAYTLPRGADPSITDVYPEDRLFIQRYTLPINMLCNEKSFSNAEITAHAFKTLGRGKLVGQQTYGGVISTGGWSLIDGTHVRLPFRGWFSNDGTDMENHGAIPDILVPQTPEAESRDEDEQLTAAVEDLLKRVK